MGKVADIKVGYSCNNDCFHCVIADKRRELLLDNKSPDRTTEMVKQEIDEAYENGADTIVITGGEATIRRDFFEILEYALSKTEIVLLQTNGRMFYYEEFAKRLASYTRVYVTIALHSSNPKLHDEITGSKDSFKQTTIGIKNLVKHGIKHRIGGKIVISKKNMHDLENLIELCSKLGCKSVNIAFPHAMGNARLNFYDCIPRYSEIADEILNTTKKSLEIGMHIDWEAIPLCFLPGYETFASEFRMPAHSELRDLTNKESNYSRVRHSIAKRKSPVCRECRFNLVCEGVWDDYEKGYDVSELKAVKGELVTTENLNELESFKIHPIPIVDRNINTIISDKTQRNDKKNESFDVI
jgi:MoaA/NifB/PqqE/SkfB family radical SAM enzyme